MQKNKVVHFEIGVSDFEKAKGFYSSIFDWKFIDMGVAEYDYLLIQTVETDEQGMPKESGGINGGMYKRPKVVAKDTAENAYVCTVAVENIDETMEKVKAAGGKISVPKGEVANVGFVCRCLDLDGNIFGLIQPTKS